MGKPATHETDVPREYMAGDIGSAADAAYVALNPASGNITTWGIEGYDVQSPLNPSGPARFDGVTDDSASWAAAITAATGKGPVIAGDGVSVLTSVRSMPKGTRLRGTYRLGQTYGTVLQGSGATNLLQFAYPSIGFDGGTAAVAIEGFHFLGGTDQLYCPNGGVWVTIRDCTFDSPTHAGVYCRSFVQDWDVDRVEFSGGQYGFYYPYETGADGGTSILFDKNKFRAIDCILQTINAFYVSIALSNNCRWDNLRMGRSVQDAFIFGGTIRDWSFDNVNTEANGWLGSAPTAATTGTGTSGTNALTVASGTGYGNGDTVTIAGGGAAGVDLVTTISTGGGTTSWTLGTNLLTNVTTADVTKYLYSDFKAISNAAPNGGAAQMVWSNYGSLGTNNLSALRYAMDLSAMAGGSLLLMCPGANPRPVYDPNGLVETFASPASIRRKAGTTANDLRVNGNLVTGGASGLLDVSAAAAAMVATGSGVGDKIALHSAGYGLGVQAGRLVLFAPTGANGIGFRRWSSSGQGSSGSERFTFDFNGDKFLVAASGVIDATSAGALNIAPTTATALNLGNATSLVNFAYAVTALGGGAAPTLGTIGASGPAAAAQNSWLKVNVAGTASFIPVWR